MLVVSGTQTYSLFGEEEPLQSVSREEASGASVGADELHRVLLPAGDGDTGSGCHYLHDHLVKFLVAVL